MTSDTATATVSCGTSEDPCVMVMADLQYIAFGLLLAALLFFAVIAAVRAESVPVLRG